MVSPDIDKLTSTCISLTPTGPVPTSSHSDLTNPANAPIHGLTCDPSFLTSLPVLSERPPPHPPIRALSAPQFRELHLQYLLSHAPDSVIFPFLHGLEGNNLAQNAFFANAGNAPWKEGANANGGGTNGIKNAVNGNGVNDVGNGKVVCEDGLEGKGNKGRIYPEIPRFRGLIWVAADSPSPSSSSNPDSPTSNYSDDIDYSDDCSSSSSSSEDSEDEIDPSDDYSAMTGLPPISGHPVAHDQHVGVGMDMEMDMDVDDQDVGVDMLGEPPVVKVPKLGGEEAHMHPVIERDRRASHASTTSTYTSSSTYSEEQDGQKAPPPSPISPTSPTSLDTLNTPELTDSSFSPPTTPELESPISASPINPPPPFSSPDAKDLGANKQTATTKKRSVVLAPQRPPPMLTSTFRPEEVLKPLPPPPPHAMHHLRSHPHHHPHHHPHAHGELYPRRKTELEEAARIIGGQSQARGDEKEEGEIDEDEHELKEKEGGPRSEFVDLKVPEGISLRNFGIQVPIFATLSDIVVYSPTGDTHAAVTLARRFKEAIEKKYQDRLTKIRRQLRGEDGEEDGPRSEDSATPRPPSSAASSLSPEEQAEADLLLKYNVFVLDASPEEIYAELDHLVMRVEDAADHAHTDRTDAHATGDRISPSSSGDGFDDDGEKEKERARAREKALRTRANTINFAQREKEEMRDLTRASELYTAFPPDHPLDPCSRTLRHRPLSPPSFYSSQDRSGPDAQMEGDREWKEISASTTANLWDPTLGQIFLGNAGDVPLPSDDSEGYARKERKKMKKAKQRRSSKSNSNSHSQSPSSSSSSSSYHQPPSYHHHRTYREDDDRMDEDPDVDAESYGSEDEDEVFDYRSNDPARGMGFDLCIECDDMAPFPSNSQMRAVEEHVMMLDRVWVERCLRKYEKEHESTVRTREHGVEKGSAQSVFGGLEAGGNPGGLFSAVKAQEKGHGEGEGGSADVPMDGVEEEGAQDSQPGRMIIPPRPPPNANAVVHLSFPASVNYMPNLLPFISWLESLIKPVAEPLTFDVVRDPSPESEPLRSLTEKEPERGGVKPPFNRHGSSGGSAFSPSSLPPPSAFQNTFLPSSSTAPPSSYHRSRSSSSAYPTSSSSSSSSRASTPLRFSPVPTSNNTRVVPPHHLSHHPQPPPQPQPVRTRPLKILIYSADGYTESSSLALCLLMALRQLCLPEAYLELQIEKRRSFFVYQNEVAAMKRIESRLEKERHPGLGHHHHTWGNRGWNPSSMNVNGGGGPSMPMGGRPSAQSVSFASPPSSFFSASRNPNDLHPLSSSIPAQMGASRLEIDAGKNLGPGGRQRANTTSVLPSFTDHQAWFNDPRFDGSFPSRVLPFLYLGNLNHASNVYMLHALGITHVVSVGECALVPPPSHAPTAAEHVHAYHTSSGCQFLPGKGPAGQGSLWIEEREGRIKVLDIKGVCDDGIDTLEPQLEPICDWIDRARAEGGKVLVHCRVGVSRSATVTIAYVMKYLQIPLVDAYLIVRSRRLSVLIQPNMRLLYNLLGWEIKLAKQRAGDDEDLLRLEMARCLNWPYLAKEVHLLNEKYLH